MKSQRPNIILITIDALRFDHLDCYGYHRNTSPYIGSLAAKGALFSQAISNGGQTPDAFPSILASAQPRVAHFGSMSKPRTMLAEKLKEVGYQTASFHSNPLLSRYHGYDRGFDLFIDSLGESGLFRRRIWVRTKVGSLHRLTNKTLSKLSKILSPVLSRVGQEPIITAEMINSRALSWLKEHRKGFFLWLHYMDVHSPYLASPQYLRQFHDQTVTHRKIIKLCREMLEDPAKLSPDEVTTLINLYDAQIRYVDDNISSLLTSLDVDLTNTIIIITADHGEEFGEHGKFGHRSLYDGIMRVPLMIVGPGIKAGTVVNKQVSLIDLAPTITDLVGIDSVPHFQGQSMLPVMKGVESAAQGTISTFNELGSGRRYIAYRTPEWKYIRTEGLGEVNTLISEELYNLRDDPKEGRNLYGLGDGEAKAFKLKAVNKIMELKRLKREEETAYEKERIRARLKKIPKL